MSTRLLFDNCLLGTLCETKKKVVSQNANSAFSKVDFFVGKKRCLHTTLS